MLAATTRLGLIDHSLRREIRKIVFDHFELIVEEWDRYFGGR
jgi:hypothetical protein